MTDPLDLRTSPTEGRLLDRVQQAIGHTYPNDARAAIREVAEWLKQGRMLHAAELLDLELKR